MGWGAANITESEYGGQIFRLHSTVKSLKDFNQGNTERERERFKEK